MLRSRAFNRATPYCPASSAGAAAAFLLRQRVSNSSCGLFSSASASCVSSRRSFHSLSLEQAMRITAPSVKHPASGDPKNPDASHEAEPEIVWREHWDVEFERPYYHNLVTNEVRTTLPENFPTRFLFYYQKKHGGVKHEPSDAGALPKHATRALTVKERIKEYGLAGLVLYGIIHTVCLVIVFVIMAAGVDLSGIIKSLGFEAHRAHGTSLWALWLAAVITNKMFVPLQALLTVALAPRFAPVIRQVLARFGIKP